MKEKLIGLKNKTSLFFQKINDSFLTWFHKHDLLIYFIIINIIAVAIRVLLFPKISGDYSSFLKPWYINFYENGFSALGSQNGDYTPAYNYFLYILSLFRLSYEPIGKVLDYEIIPSLIGIKVISCLFDFGIAIFVYFITKNLTQSKINGVFAYSLTVLGLTVFLNSSLWGQCDSIYCFFIVGSIYFLLKDKQHLAYIFLGISFAFKLQTIFVLPVYLILYLKKQTKLRYLLYIPLIYFIFALPSSFAAGSNFFFRLGQIFSVYYNQSVHGYSEVALNCGSFYSLIFTNFKGEDFISSFGLCLFIAINGTLIFLFEKSKIKFTGKNLVKLFVVFMMTMPYFMVHTHDRYFYLADVMIIVYVFLNPKRFYVAIMAILNSMIGYMVYLWNVPFINVVPQDGTIPDNTKALSFRFGAAIYLVAIIIILKDFFNDIKDEENTLMIASDQEESQTSL